MKIEQACRFRLDEGYSVFAKSPGLQPNHEVALGNIFNSAMNSIFHDVGESILTCTTDNTDVFLARNTLRTDIHGRKTMFTHAYIFPVDDYVRTMQEDPMAILGVEMTSMLENQSAGAQMDTLENLNPTVGSVDTDALFEKYNLNPTRYSRLLLGAYLALTSDRSLQLVTALPLDQTAPMVREIILCILKGLLPCLKGTVTFSTGPDTRMKISVISTANNSSPSGDLLFGVEDDRYTTVRARDRITEVTFDGISNAPDRETVLQEMQDWLAEAVALNERLPLPLICTAYCLCSGMELNTGILLTLFQSISNAKGISANVANALLANLVRQMNEGSGCNEDALSLIAAWYLGNSNKRFRDEADISLANTSENICVALTEAALAQEPSENVNLFIKTLLRRIAAGIPLTDEALKTSIILWILGENVTEFTAYASQLMAGITRNQRFDLAKGILENSRNRSLTNAEMATLDTALRSLTEENTRLPANYEVLLDAQSAHYSPNLEASARAYLFRLRMNGLDPREGLELIDSLRTNCPAFFPGVLSALPQNAPAVWERYQTRECFPATITPQALETLLRDYNTFNNPGGPFEQRAAQCVLAMVRANFAEYPADKTQMCYYSDVVVKRWLHYLGQINISEEAARKISTQIAIIFWQTVTVEQIFSNSQPILDRVFVKLPETEEKLLLACMCLGLREKEHDASELIKMITDPNTAEDRMELLLNCATKMTFVLLKEYKYLSWDLVLLSCWVHGEKESGPDAKALSGVFGAIDNYFARQKSPVETGIEHSVLLKDERLRKAVIRMSISSDTYQKLLQQLKPDRGGLFGLFNRDHGDKQPEEKKSRDKAPMEPSPEVRRPGRGGNQYFDPTQIDAKDDRRKGRRK